MYPPPYQGGYATPWAWIDGHNCGYQYGGWAGYVSQQMLVPTSVSMSMTGTYDPVGRTGQIQAVFFNSGMSPANGSCFMVITEDSLNYTGPNGDPWHNHVCRDYLPDQVGTAISIPSGGYDTVVQTYTLQPTWVERMCNVVVYAQDMSMHPDSGYGAFQGGTAPVLSFVGVQEPSIPASFYRNVTVNAAPNPCRAIARFNFTSEPNLAYRLGIYALDGSLVHEFDGTTRSGANTLVWDRTDASGQRVARGVYGYRLSVTGASATGKLVVSE